MDKTLIRPDLRQFVQSKWRQIAHDKYVYELSFLVPGHPETRVQGLFESDAGIYKDPTMKEMVEVQCLQSLLIQCPSLRIQGTTLDRRIGAHIPIQPLAPPKSDLEGFTFHEAVSERERAKLLKGFKSQVEA